MARKSLGKELGALITENNPNNIDKNNILDDAGTDTTKLESVSDSKLDVAWESPEETQRLEVYETALKRAWQDGAISPDEKGIIDDMRSHLRITDSEHREIELKIIAQQELMKNIESLKQMEEDDKESEVIDCPKCSSEIVIEYSDKEKIHLKCPDCGAKGRIPNPFLKDVKKKAVMKEEEKKITEKKEVNKKDKKKDKKEEIKVEPPEMELKAGVEPQGPERVVDEPPIVPEPTFPQAVRLFDDTPECMAFMCPHCQSPFQSSPTEDPQKIPCPTCSKNVTIIRPITFECPGCENTFPSVLQTDAKVMPCPYCAVEIELKK